MKLLTALTIGLHIFGLATVQAVEAWRPGVVSGALNIGVLWLWSVAMIGFSWWFDQRSRPAQSPAPDGKR